MGEPERDRIGPGRLREFVDEALVEERLEREPDRTPDADRDRQRDDLVVDPQVRDLVSLVGRALDRRLVWAGRREADQTCGDGDRRGLAGGARMQRDDATVGDRTLDAGDGTRADVLRRALADLEATDRSAGRPPDG